MPVCRAFVKTSNYRYHRSKITFLLTIIIPFSKILLMTIFYAFFTVTVFADIAI